MNLGLLIKLPFFSLAYRDEPFVSAYCKMLLPRMFAPKDILVYPDMPWGEMYIIRSGMVRVLLAWHPYYECYEFLV